MIKIIPWHNLIRKRIIYFNKIKNVFLSSIFMAYEEELMNIPNQFNSVLTKLNNLLQKKEQEEPVKRLKEYQEIVRVDR